MYCCLAASNRTLSTYEGVDDNGFTRLLDINQDGRYELFLARFATVELLARPGHQRNRPGMELFPRL